MDEARTQGLTGLRGVAVLLVLFSHASNHGLYVLPGVSFSGAGRYGVYLFFVLSAFLLTRQFLLSVSVSNDRSAFLSRYFRRRFLRIYPLFLISLVCYALYSALTGTGLYITSLERLVEHALLIRGVGIFWTIPVEFKYYFLLPIVALGFRGGRTSAIATVVAILFVLAAVERFTIIQFDGALLPFLGVFLLGSFTAYLSVCISQHISLITEQVLDGLGIVSLLGFFALIPSFLNGLFGTDLPHTYFHKNIYLFTVMSCLVVLGIIHGSGQLRKLLEVRPLCYMGEISFSVYVWHILILKSLLFFGGAGNPIAGLYLFVVLTLLWSSVSYWKIEKNLLESTYLNEWWVKSEAWIKKKLGCVPERT